jgi:hypothetical protein
VPLTGNVLFEIVPSAAGRRLALSTPGSGAQQGVVLDIATAAPVGPHFSFEEAAVVSAALPDGGFLGAAGGQLRRRSEAGDQIGSPLNLHVTAADVAYRRLAIDRDTAYVAGRDGVAIVSVPLIDGAPGQSKLGRPIRGFEGFPIPEAGGLLVAAPNPFYPAAATSSDGRLIAAAGFSGVLSVFDTDALSLVHSIPYATNRPIDTEFTQGLSAGEAGRWAAATWVNETTAILSAWDAVTAIDLATARNDGKRAASGTA